MSDTVTLTLRAPLAATLDLERVTPDRCLGLGEAEVAALPVWLGGREVALGDLFAVSGGRSAHVRLEGDLAAAINVGAAMSTGELVVQGNVGDDAGVAMSGGVLRIHGNAGARLGAARPGAARGMTGGEIIVDGSTAADAGARARRGLIVVRGDTGSDAGRAMIAGTLVVLGCSGEHPGRGNKRGSIICAGAIEVPPTYRYACTYQPTFVRLVLVYLRRHYQMPIDERLVHGHYRRYCGDAGDPGKGEILVLDHEPGGDAV